MCCQCLKGPARQCCHCTLFVYLCITIVIKKRSRINKVFFYTPTNKPHVTEVKAQIGPWLYPKSYHPSTVDARIGTLPSAAAAVINGNQKLQRKHRVRGLSFTVLNVSGKHPDDPAAVAGPTRRAASQWQASPTRPLCGAGELGSVSLAGGWASQRWPPPRRRRVGD